MDIKIKRLEEKIVYSDPNNPWVKLYFDRVKFPDGREGRYNRIVEGNGADGVAVLPLKEGMVGLVYQYRYPVGKEMWEVPRGFGESKDPRIDAARELQEEMGIVINPESLISLGCLHPNSGLLQSKVQLYIAKCKTAHEKSGAIDSEISKVRWFSIRDVFSMIELGDITDVFTLTSFLWSNLRGFLKE
jgi:ADP-ribose pyrophosphatase